MSAISPIMKSSLRVAVLQTKVFPEKASSLRGMLRISVVLYLTTLGARETLLAAIDISKPDLCVIGEMFTCPYHPKYESMCISSA